MKRAAAAGESFQLKIGRACDDGAPITLDVEELIETKMLVCANSGAGKSMLIRLLIEQTIDRIPTIVIDPEGEYATLRERHDFVLVGEDGEVPCAVETAAKLARRLVELRVSSVIDLCKIAGAARGSNVKVQKQLFVKHFLDGLIDLPRSLWRPMLVVIDEVHRFAEEGAKCVSTDSVIAFQDAGRKRGLGAVLATQRLAKLDMNARSETNNVVIGRLAHDIDHKRVAPIIGLAEKDAREILRELEGPTKLPKDGSKPKGPLLGGEFYAFGPAFAHRGFVLFRADRPKTTHPKLEERGMLPPRASSSIQRVAAEISDLAAAVKAEADEHGALRERVRDLERQLADASAGVEGVGDAGLRAQLQSLELQLAQREAEIAEQRDVAPDELEGAYRRGMTAVVRTARELLEDRFRLLHDAFGSLLQEEKAAIFAQDLFASPDHGFCRIREAATAGHAARPSELVVDKVERVDWGPLTPLPGPRLYADAHASAATPHPKNGTPAPASAPARAPAADGGARDRMLVALLQHPGPVPKRRVALLAHVRLGGSSWRGGLAALRKDELVADADVDEIVATTAARKAYAGKVPRLPTGRELLAYWQSYLKNSAAARMFAVVAENPRGVQKKAIEARTGITLGGSSWRGGLATLRNLGLVVDLHGDVIALSPHLF